MGEVIKAPFGKPGALRFGMTARQRKALSYIRGEIDATGQWPAMADIQAHIGVNTTIGTIMIVQHLVDMGFVPAWSSPNPASSSPQ